jgi:hypothetical protein
VVIVTKPPDHALLAARFRVRCLAILAYSILVIAPVAVLTSTRWTLGAILASSLVWTLAGERRIPADDRPSGS